MEKLKMHSANLTQDNIARIRDLFPGCITEAKGKDGSVKLGVDFDQLRQELAESIIEGPQERYHLNWPGRREALLNANAPIAKTLRPVRAQQDKNQVTLEEGVDFDTTRNLFIEGDNLDALKLLQEAYLSKVKFIYIDPPYNTGKDFIYKDNFAQDVEEYKRVSNQTDSVGGRLVSNPESNGRFHSAWLSMIYSRLRVARNLLRNDGLIAISIDSGEAANLRLLMDEVFGSHNFIGLLPTVMNLKGNNDAFAFSDTHEFTVVYAKSREECSVNELPIDEEKLDDWDEDERGLFKRADTLRRTGQDAARERRPNGWFPVFIDDDENVYVTENDEPKSERHTVVWPVNDDGEELSWTWSKKKISDEGFNLIVVDGRSGKNIYKKQRPGLGDLPTSKPKSILYRPEYSSSNGTAEIAELLGKNVFDSPPKPRALLRDLITLGADKDSIVLDFFAGTGTTAHAVLGLNASDGGTRRFILVQIDAPIEVGSIADKAGYKTISEITKARLRKAGEKLLNAPAHSEWNKDVGFRVLKIDTSNFSGIYYSPDALEKSNLDMFFDNIKPDRTPEDLLFQVMLDWGVDLALPIAKQAIQGKDVFLVDGNALVACFDGHGGVDEAFVKELAKVQPLRVVFRDAGFKDSSVKINVEQIFKLLSPATEVKCI